MAQDLNIEIYSRVALKQALSSFNRLAYKQPLNLVGNKPRGWDI